MKKQNEVCIFLAFLFPANLHISIPLSTCLLCGVNMPLYDVRCGACREMVFHLESDPVRARSS